MAFILSLEYLARVEIPNESIRISLHTQILEKTADSPYRYRLLIPYTAHFLFVTLSKITDQKTAFRTAFQVLDFSGLLVFFFLLWRWFRGWFGEGLSLLGMAAAGVALHTALKDHAYQPWSIWEGVFMTAGLLALRSGTPAALGGWIALMVLAALNRETSIFAIMASVPVALDKWKKGIPPRDWIKRLVVWSGSGLLGWGVISIALRLSLGDAPHEFTLGETWELNTRPEALWHALDNSIGLFGIFWILAALGFPRAPGMLKRIALILPLVFAIFLIWGTWYEVRIWIPTYPIILALGLARLDMLNREAPPAVTATP